VKLRLASALFLLLAVSAEAQEREPAPQPQDPSLATIRGDVVGGTFGKDSSRVLYIDGRFLPGELETCDRHDLAPGPHSLIVVYKNRLMPVRIDAAPGDVFVVKWEDDSDDTVYVENEATNETVFRRPLRDAEVVLMSETLIGQIIGDKAPNVSYVEPAGEDTALVTARARKVEKFLLGEQDEGEVRIVAIDGERLAEDTHAIRVSSGPRALAFYLSFYIGMDGNYQPVYGWAKIPVMLDARPGASYTLGYEPPQIGLGPKHIAIWLKDDATGEVVVPKALALINIGYQLGGFSYREAPSFPEGKGQLKRPPPKPKLWCERED